MSSNRKRIKNLSDAEYAEYIATLKDDASLYNADGSLAVPNNIAQDEEENKLGE